MPVRVATATLSNDFLVGQVDVVDGDAALQLDVVANEPAGAVQVELGLPPAKVGLAQRGLAYGRAGSVVRIRTGMRGCLLRNVSAALNLPDHCRWR